VAKAKADKAAIAKGPTAPEVKIETSVRGGKIVNNTEMVSRKEPTSPWVMLAQSMICSNEFVYLNRFPHSERLVSPQNPLTIQPTSNSP
jgi:hypothetical protein